MITLEKLSSFCNVLNQNGVKYILIGGCAVILHGLERPTYDIDFLIENTEENINRIKKALLTYLDVDTVKEITPDMFRKYKVVRVGLGDYYVDFMTQIGDVDYKVAESDAYIEKINNVEIPVAGLDTMIKLKQGFPESDIKDRLFLEGKKHYLKEKEENKNPTI
ncbi:hypothetical protein DRQ16_02295 [bacterium]|nr:MAG: hypothetical protein DRQ16_02295 [bacterium]